MITRVEFDNFLVFKNLSIDFCPGINVIIGENGTGKTLLLRVLKCVCRSDDSVQDLAFDRLVREEFRGEFTAGRVSAFLYGSYLSFSYAGEKDESAPFLVAMAKLADVMRLRGSDNVRYAQITGATDIETNFEMTHPKESQDEKIGRVVKLIEKAAGGRFSFVYENGIVEPGGCTFKRRGERCKPRDFRMLSSGQQKLALLWLLARDGISRDLSVLILDDAEQNLSPSILDKVAQALIELQRLGVQIFLSTYSYILMKELELGKTENDKLLFHSLYRGDDCEVHVQSCLDRRALVEDVTQEAGMRVYDKEIDRLLS